MVKNILCLQTGQLARNDGMDFRIRSSESVNSVCSYFLLRLYVPVISIEAILPPSYECMLAEWMWGGGTSLFI